MDAAAQRRIHALVRVGRAMSSTADYEQALETLIEAISDMLDVETAGFLLYDPNSDELQLQQPAFGIADPDVIGIYRAPLSQGGNAVRVFLTREPYLSNHVAQDRRIIARYAQLFDTRNTMTVPLVVEDEAIGVCHVINKRSGDFTGDDLDLFALVAPLLAVSVQSAAMFRQVRQQRRQLERAVYLQRELSRTAFDAPGIGSLTERLADLVNLPVMVIDASLRPLAASHWPQGLEPSQEWLGSDTEFGVTAHPAHDGYPALAPIAVGSHFGGYLAVAADDAELDELEVRAVEHAASIFALEMLRERTSYEVESRIKGGLIQDLVAGSYAGQENARELLSELGYSTEGPWRVVGVLPRWRRPEAGQGLRDEVHGPTARFYPVLRELCQQHFGTPAVAPWRSGFLVLLPAASEVPEQDTVLAERLLEEVRAAADELRPGSSVHLTVSSVVHVVAELANGLHQTERAMKVAHTLEVTDRPLIFDHLGVYRVLLGGSGPEQRASFVEESLGPIESYDTEHGTDLLATLRVYVESDYVAAEAARRLYVHPNTLAYRLRTLRRLLGGDPARGDLRLQTELALKLQDMSALSGLAT